MRVTARKPRRAVTASGLHPNGVNWRVGLTVTHYDSGKLVCEVPHHTVAACCNDTKAAAKMALDKLIEKAGPERVRSVLAGA